jgi:hypothetical protein
MGESPARNQAICPMSGENWEGTFINTDKWPFGLGLSCVDLRGVVSAQHKAQVL